MRGMRRKGRRGRGRKRVEDEFQIPRSCAVIHTVIQGG